MTAARADSLDELPSLVPRGEAVRVERTAPGTRAVLAVDALGCARSALEVPGGWELSDLPPATYEIQAIGAQGRRDTTHVVIPRWPGDSPVPAFATELSDTRGAERALGWLRSMRATLVQVYDWMKSYSDPEPPPGPYRDPLGRALDGRVLSRLTRGVGELGAVAQAYAPVLAADADWARSHRDEVLRQNDGVDEHLGEILTIMHPGRPPFLAHWLATYGQAARLGFTGLHLDTYGYPRVPRDGASNPVDMRAAYTAFLDRVRRALPGMFLTFNQVNGHPGALELPGPSMARYVEVWPPNSGWRHLEGLLLRAGARGSEPRILAIYPPDWSDRRGALDGAMRTLAVACLMGADVMMLGGDGGLLFDPYYPRHVTLTAPERRRVLAWHRFTLSVRDLFRRGEDTSWEEVTGPGGSVEVRTRVAAGPEPGSGLLVRVRRGEGWLAVGLVNLTGSARGLWTEPCGPARPVPASVGALLDDPERYRARVTALGAEAADGVDLRLEATERGTVAWVDLPAVRTFTVVVFKRPGARL